MSQNVLERKRERRIKAAENLGSIKYRCPCFKPSHAYTTWDLHNTTNLGPAQPGGLVFEAESEIDDYSYQLQEVYHIPSCTITATIRMMHSQ